MNNGVVNNNQTNTNINPQSVPVQQSVTNVQVPNVAPPNVNNISVGEAPVPENISKEQKSEDNIEKKKKKGSLVPLLILIIIGLAFYLVYSIQTYRAQIENLIYNCTAVNSSKDEVKLDLNSTLVQDLYHKVQTNIREDLAQPEFNDNLKLYLAYRQILETSKYDSNCNMFDPTKMEPYTCEVSLKFVPKAFKEEDLVLELKKLFGENNEIVLDNIKLANSCIGGYQYIKERGEFVQGLCTQQTATSFKVTKTLKEAVSTRNTIILTEEVKYQENEKMELPSYLKSGIYYYTFRLDLNYNYVLVSKTYESKY